MTDLIAQAEALEWARDKSDGTIRSRIAELRAQAAQPPAEQPVSGEIVGWAQLGMINGKSYLRETFRDTNYPPSAQVIRNLNLKPLFTQPDPRIAEYRALLLDWVECKRDKLELFDATMAALNREGA